VPHEHVAVAQKPGVRGGRLPKKPARRFALELNAAHILMPRGQGKVQVMPGGAFVKVAVKLPDLV